MDFAGLDNVELLEGGEGLVGITIDVSTNAGSFSSSCSAIGIVEFDGGTADTCQRIAE